MANLLPVIFRFCVSGQSRLLVLLSCLCFLCCPAALEAQGVDIRGTVVDSVSGERIPFANVTILGTNRGTATNLNGFYLLASVPSGTVEVVVSVVGYGRKSTTIAATPGNPITVNFRMSPKPVELSEVVVEGEQGPERLDAASLHVLSLRQMQDIPTAGQEDVLRAIQTLPGIVSTADVSSKFYVRGGAGDQNLVLLDGMRIYNPYHAFGVFSVFDPDIISTSEVYTGAFPAGFGNRLSSVVNLTTRQGNTQRLAGRSELNFLTGKVELEGPMGGNNSWILSGRQSLFDGPFRHFLRSPAPISFYDVFFKGTLGGETGRNSARGFFSGDDIVSDKPDEPDYSWRNQSLAVSVSGLAYDRLYVDGVAYSSRFSVTRNAKASTLVRPAESRVADDGMRMEFTIHTDTRDVFLTGFQFDIPEYDNTYTTPGNAQQTLSTVDTELWLWFRHQKDFGNFQTDLGVHCDLVSLFDHGPDVGTLQPRVSVRYSLSDAWRARLSFGTYNQRVITISNEDDITSLFDAWLPIPENLHAEEAYHYVFGVEGMLFPRLSVDLQSYLKRYPSLVLYNREKFYPSDPDYINGTGKAYGGELSIRYTSSWTDLSCAYSLGWTSVTVNGFTYSPRYDRRHTINALGVIHVLDNVDFSARWEFGSGYPFTQTVGYYDRVLFGAIGGESSLSETGAPYSILGDKNAARLPAYYRIDCSLTYHFVLSPLHGALGVSVANLTNRKNVLFYDRSTGQRINMLDFFPSASLKVEY